jgi:hypothetical protein
MSIITLAIVAVGLTLALSAVIMLCAEVLAKYATQHEQDERD